MRSWWLGVGAATVLVWGSAILARERPRAVGYEQVRPILVENCLDCHNQDKRKGGLSLSTYADILEGGKDGAVVRPGRSVDSLLIHRITGTVGEQMPKDGAPLSEGEIALIRQWIDDGARAMPNGPPAPAPWEAPLALTRPAVPAMVWRSWSEPADRLVAAYLSARRTPEPALVSDAVFARRAYLDLWGLLPTPEQLESFLADRSPAKRTALVTRLAGDNDRYAEHWISFWNDLLRNDDGTRYFSETSERKSITPWLLASLRANLSYDQFVSALLNPAAPAGPDGFLTGVNWRGETSAAVTPWMQASQNTAQVFLGINLKCNSCHDSFISKWTLKDAYGLASYFSPTARLQLFRCDAAQDQFAEPAFLYPELTRAPASASLADRRAAIAAVFTDPRNGRLPRTLVNRVWQRLLGRGIVTNADEMDGRPWNPALLDWLAADFAEHQYDIKRLITTIVASRAYQMPAVPRAAEPPARDYVFEGPEVRRLTAEQFSDAIGSITGEWSASLVGARTSTGGGRNGGPAPSDPPAVGVYAREWRNGSTDLTRALGRPIRDQVTSVRATEPTTPQALELVNGETLTTRLWLGARRLLGLLGDTPSLHNKAVGGRLATATPFEVDVSASTRLWLLVQDTGSNLPAQVLPVWAQGEFVDAGGTSTPLSALIPVDASGLRPGSGSIWINGVPSSAVRVRNSSRLVYDIAGKGFTRLRGTMWVENPVAEIGQTLDPQLRFYIFDREPDMGRLLPPLPGPPLPPGVAVTSASQTVDRIFRHALGRLPTAAEKQTAENALQDPSRPGHPSVEGLADLLWAVLMKPEFQLIY